MNAGYDSRLVYMSYLIYKVPEHLLKDFSNQLKPDFSMMLRCLTTFYGREDKQKRAEREQKVIDNVETKIHHYLDTHNINYMMKDEFKERSRNSL